MSTISCTTTTAEWTRLISNSIRAVMPENEIKCGFSTAFSWGSVERRFCQRWRFLCGSEVQVRLFICISACFRKSKCCSSNETLWGPIDKNMPEPVPGLGYRSPTVRCYLQIHQSVSKNVPPNQLRSSGRATKVAWKPSRRATWKNLCEDLMDHDYHHHIIQLCAEMLTACVSSAFKVTAFKIRLLFFTSWR